MKTLRTMKKALLRVWRPFKKAFGVALVLTALVCGMIETPDMLEIWLRIIGALAFGAGAVAGRGLRVATSKGDCG